MDPRHTTVGPQARKANLSPLMEALGKASAGEAVNACPFGCTVAELDERGHCFHLCGFTLPGNDKQMERLLAPDERGRRKMRGAKSKVIDGERVLIGEKLPKDAKLERITVSSRVYDPAAKPFPATDDDDKPEQSRSSRAAA